MPGLQVTQIDHVSVIITDVEETGDWNDQTFSTRLACSRCRRTVPDLEPRRFHFNNPHGACSHCTGLGVVGEGDDDASFPRSAWERGGTPLSGMWRRAAQSRGSRRPLWCGHVA